MRGAGLRVEARAPYRPKTTRADQAATPSPNLLAQAGAPMAPGTYLVSDIPYIEAGCTDNVIDEPGQTLNIVDHGTRTIINRVAQNAGDPNTEGDWNGHAKAGGLIIYDNVNDVYYLYVTPTVRKVL